MQVEYKLKLGQDEFTLKADVKDEKDFFEQMSFYSNLPRTAPGGATDLKLVFRSTKKGHKYYSLISEIEQMEFKLGQNLEASGGGLFPKGWERAHSNENSNEGFPQTTPLIGQPQVQTIPKVAAPVPSVTLKGPTKATGGIDFSKLTKAVEEVKVETPKVVQAEASPEVAKVTADVLARFKFNN